MKLHNSWSSQYKDPVLQAPFMRLFMIGAPVLSLLQSRLVKTRWFLNRRGWFCLTVQQTGKSKGTVSASSWFLSRTSRYFDSWKPIRGQEVLPEERRALSRLSSLPQPVLKTTQPSLWEQHSFFRENGLLTQTF